MLVQINHSFRVNNSCINPPQKFSGISFRGECDSFSSHPQILQGHIPSHEIDGIIKTVSTAKEEGSGYSAVVYKHNGYIIKKMKQQTEEYKKYHLGDSNLKEYFALKEAESVNPDISPIAHGIIKYRGDSLLVEDFVTGVHPEGQHLTNKQVRDLMTKFSQLDKVGIQHCDLQSGNIFLTDDKTARLIDFGSFHYINNDGLVISSDISMAKDVESSLAINPKDRVKKAITKNWIIGDIKQVSDNPHSRLFSNVSNFEFRTLFTHLLDGSEENPLEFFTDYLKEKGATYHRNMANFYESFLPRDYEFMERFNNLNEEDKTILQARNYEKVAEEVLQSPTDDVIKTELYKMQLKAFSSSSNDIGSSIPSKQKQASIYDKLVTLLKSNIEKSDGIYRTYFEENLKKIDSYAPLIESMNTVEVPENEDIINCLFNGIKSPLLNKREDIKTKNNDKNSSIFLKSFLSVFGLKLTGSNN